MNATTQTRRETTDEMARRARRVATSFQSPTMAVPELINQMADRLEEQGERLKAISGAVGTAAVLASDERFDAYMNGALSETEAGGAALEEQLATDAGIDFDQIESGVVA